MTKRCVVLVPLHVGRYGYSWEDATGDRQRYENVKMILK